MKISAIEIKGFKSFADKVTLNCNDDQIIVITGPNGCGKSNIADAIRWTMGEQSIKTLRGNSMEDVIFAGNESRAEANSAKNSLIFLDTESKNKKKLIVTRTLDRTGENQYLIDNNISRLGKVRELLMTNGFAQKHVIIEQGKIDQIVTSKPEEKRKIIDDAANLSHYKLKIKEVEKKLEVANNNLIRIQDILPELTNREKELSIQSKEAESHQIINAKIELLKKQILATQWSQLCAQADQFLKDRKIFLEQITKLESELKTLNEKIDKTNNQITEANKKLEIEEANKTKIATKYRTI